MVSSVITSCGCTQPKWPGGIIQPGKDQELTFNFVPSSFGEGKFAKQVALRFPDSSVATFEIVGVGKKAQSIQRLSISPENFLLDMSDPLFNDRVSWNLNAKLAGQSGDLSKLSVKSEVDWLKPEINTMKDGTATLRTEVRLDAAPIKQLGEGASDLTGEILLTSSDGGPAIPIDVRLIYKLLQVEPSLADVHRKNGAAVSFEIFNRQDKAIQSLQLIDPIPMANGLVIDSVRKQGERVSVKVRAKSDAEIGPHVVNCAVVNTATKKRLGAKFVVNVVE